MLTELGMSDLHERVYVELLNARVDSAVGLATVLGVDLADIRAAVSTLEEHGLVRTSSNGSGGLRAAPPDLAVDALFLQRLARLQRARLDLPEWAARHLSPQGRTGRGEDVGEILETAVGGPAITAAFERFQRSAQREIRAFDSPPYSLPNDENYAELEALDRGVTYRVVYDRSALELPQAVRRISAHPANPRRMLPVYDSGDSLHQSDAGYEAMGNAIPLDLFQMGGTSSYPLTPLKPAA